MKFSHRIILCYRFISLWLVLAFATSVYALDVSDFTFSHIGMKEGLPSHRIYSIIQLSDESVWFATKCGVCRTNGVNIATYDFSSGILNRNSEGNIVKLAALQHGECTEDLLYAFDSTGRFLKYNSVQNRFDLFFNVADYLSPFIVVNDALITDDGIWIAMREGVFIFRDHSLIPVVKDIYVSKFIPVADKILVCTRKGVFQVLEEQTLDRYSLSLLAEINAECGYYDADNGKLWLGSNDEGVFVSSIKVPVVNEKIIPLAITQISGIKNNPVRSLVPYDLNTMLMGVDGLGVFEVSRKSPKECRLLFDANNGPHGVLHGNGIYDILVDSWNNILIGSYSGGIDIARAVGSTAAIVNYARNNPQSLSNDHVNCVYQLDDERILMGTDNGLSMYNMKTKLWKHFGAGMVVLDICSKSDGSILLATYGNGVCEIASDGEIKPFVQKRSPVFKDNQVFCLYGDSSGNLWIGYLNDKLECHTPAGIQYYDINNVKSITQLYNGKLVVGTSYGLFLLKPEQNGYEELKYIKNNNACWEVLCVYADKADNLWIGTNGGGLFIHDLKTHSSRNLTIKEGLPSNYIASIIADDMERVWAGTDKGLAFVNLREPSQAFCVNYCYGLEREYTQGIAVLTNGNLLLGSVDGAVFVNPHLVDKLNYSVRLHIVRIKCDVEDDEAFNEAMSRMLKNKQVELDYNQRDFEIFYEGINLRNQFDIAYQYCIGNGEWTQPAQNLSIRFENMEPGEYCLQIRCVSRSCGIVLDEDSLSLVIHQPWWNSWWMYCFYLLLVSGAFYLAWCVYNLHTRYMRLALSRISISNESIKSFSKKYSQDVMKPLTDLSVSQPEEVEEDTDCDDNHGSEDFVDCVTQTIIANFSRSNFTIDDLCREMAMSRTLFYVKLKSYTGKSPQDFIRIIRLEHAATMLKAGRPVAEVATVVGFDNPKYFSTVFKKYFGVSPSKYR